MYLIGIKQTSNCLRYSSRTFSLYSYLFCNYYLAHVVKLKRKTEYNELEGKKVIQNKNKFDQIMNLLVEWQCELNN